MKIKIVTGFVIACSFLQSCTSGQVTKKALANFLINSDGVQQAYDVKCRITSSSEFPANRNLGPRLSFTHLRYTVQKDKRRNEVVSSDVDDSLLPTNTLQWAELSAEGKVWQVGESDNVKEHSIPIVFRVDPVSMFVLTMDSQSNGKGATQRAAQDYLNDLEFVEELLIEGERVGVWIHPKRMAILEVCCSSRSDAEMPTAFRHYYGLSPLPPNDEIGGKYHALFKRVSSATISWQRKGGMWVPNRAELTRGWKGGVYITQYWEFFDWQLGSAVEEGRLDPVSFSKNEALSSVISELNKNIHSQLEK